MTHWENAERCSGPGSTPPEEIRQITQAEWNKLIATIGSRTSGGQNSQTDNDPVSNDDDDPAMPIGADVKEVVQ